MIRRIHGIGMLTVLLTAVHAAFATPAAPPALEMYDALVQHDGCALAHGNGALTADPSPALPRSVLLHVIERQQDAAEKSAGACSTTDFVGLNPAELVSLVAATDYECLRPLFSYDADVLSIMSDANVAAVANALGSSANGLPDNANAVRQWMTFLQIAWYHEFYQAAVTFTVGTTLTAKLAVSGIAESPHFLDDGDSVASMRAQWATTIDSVNAQTAALPMIQTLFERYNNNPALHTNYYENGTIYALLVGLARQIGNNGNQGANSPWYNATPVGLVNAIATLALDDTYEKNQEYLVNNALWTLGYMKYVNPAAKLAAHAAVSDALTQYPIHSAPGVWAASTLKKFFGSLMDDGTPVDVAGLQAQLTAELFSETFVFDEGRLTFRTSIGLAKVNKLYDAMQEVESQFFRMTSNTDAVANDPNEHLTMYIYASPSDYADYHPFLFNLSTNNGGIYIEQLGSFFTYDRTPQESIYSLEELTRHEYVHYLDGRYNVSGAFGDANSMYTKTKFTWYVEGLAEYLAGSTRTHFILPRLTLTDLIADDASQMTTSELLDVTYNSGGFRFYQYGGMFFAYLQRNEPQRLLDLFWLIQLNDIDGVKAAFDAIKADAATAQGYATYLASLLSDRANNTGLFAEDIGTTYRPAILPGQNEQVLLDRLSEVGVTDILPEFSVTNDRFHYQGSVKLTAIGNMAFVQALTSQAVNNRLEALETTAPNFKAATGWFGQFVPVGNGQLQVRIYIEGPYNPNDTSLQIHTCDTTVDGVISLSELLRMIQFYNAGSMHCDGSSEDGFGTGFGMLACAPHLADYAPQDWSITLNELLRVIQFYNTGAYHPDPNGEDGFAAGVAQP